MFDEMGIYKMFKHPIMAVCLSLRVCVCVCVCICVFSNCYQVYYKYFITFVFMCQLQNKFNWQA